MQPSAAFDLYVITLEAAPAQIEQAVHALLRAELPGRVALQLRAKQLPSRPLFDLARSLRELTARRGVALLINDRVDIACAVQADGVQLPEQGLPVETARALFERPALIGVSCHDADGLRRAAESGASFATLSPVFDSPGKGPALGLEHFAKLVRAANLPVYALGGVQAEHAHALRAGGAAGLAVISAVFGDADPHAAALRFLERKG